MKELSPWQLVSISRAEFLKMEKVREISDLFLRAQNWIIQFLTIN